MALFWIAAALIVASVWVGGWFFGIGLVLKMSLTAAIALMAVGIVLLRRWKAVRAARALEAEILRQAELQAATARPDRREEIVALREQMRKGIAALKQSKLAVSSGGGALYSLPWYMIVGPAAAGKSTALRHSGLVFPFLDPSRGGAIQGLGGTRNCDWWFTNEAVLLDTAGRYATADDDRDEWLAFIDLLKKYRSRAPINGVIVAISVADLAGATEEQVEQMAAILRSRIDEVIARLQMVVPVYVMFTKADLIGGFVEFWEDLRKSERAQILGSSFTLVVEEDQQPARAFEKEFDALVEQLHCRAMARVRATRRVEVRAKVLQFPVEFASLRAPLASFVGTLFRKNAYQETPLFRGAYFSSGTQEGRPMDRMMSDMARAFGLAYGTADAGPIVDPKSYFLTDLFQKVIFPDQHLAIRTAIETRRRLLLQVAIGGVALVVALLLAVPALLSFSSNRELVTTTAALATRAKRIDPSNLATMRPAIRDAEALRARLAQLDDWEQHGAPWGYRFGMYAGTTLFPATLRQFDAVMATSLVQPVRKVLQDRLVAFQVVGTDVTPEVYSRYYSTLKVYLMLTEREHLDVNWAAPLLVRDWETSLRSDANDKPALEALVRTYLVLLKRGLIKPASRDNPIVDQSRAHLRSMPRLLGDYARLIERARVGTAPIGKSSIFGGTSADRYISAKMGVQVDGIYTRLGWARIREELKTFTDTLRGEAWVLGDDAFDPIKATADVRALYFQRYSDAWERFINALEVQRPANVDEALPELLALTEPEWPYLRLIRTVSDNVALELTDEEAGKEKSTLEGAKELVEKAKSISSASPVLPPPPRNVSPMERTFQTLTRFGISPTPAKPDDAPMPTALAQYETALRKLVAAVTDHQQKGADARGDIKPLETEFQQAYQVTMQLVADLDAPTRDLIQSLLLTPITLSWSSVVSDAAGVSSALWELNPYRACEAKILDRFPFDATSPRDATVEDFEDFFRPTQGVLWGFYEQNMKAAIEKRGNRFAPLQRFDQRPPFSGDFLEFLRRSDEITGSLFATDGKKANVAFAINLHTVSPDVSEVTFEIDGVSHSYKNTPEEWITVAWPAADAKVRGAKVRVRGYSGLVEEIPRMGDFGLFRLLGEGDLKPGTAGGRPGAERTLVATWQLKSQRATVKMDIRPSRSENPFRKDFFSDYRCPRIVTDAVR